MKKGVVADDTTGASDIGLCFSNGGARAVIYSYEPNLVIDEKDADIVIIDTDSRLDTAETSYEKVFRATEMLKRWGADFFYNKTCSVFRGNIGAEFDAMQDSLGLNRAMIVLGFPKNGRTTINGIHYVNGIELKQTQFASDPIHPMTKSDLCAILSDQTQRKVTLITCGEYCSADEMRHRLKSMGGYIIFDVRDDKDLEYLAECLKDQINLCGSSAIAEYLPSAWGINRQHCVSNSRHKNPTCGVLVLAGSLTRQTAEQVEFAGQYMKTIRLDTLQLIKAITDNLALNELKANIADACTNEILAGKNAVLYTANAHEDVIKTKQEAAKICMDDKAAGKYISDFMAEVAKKIISASALKGFIVLGGDTSAGIVKSLGIKKMYVGSQIEPGIPLLTGGEIENYTFALKSGSFGSRDFILKAIDLIKRGGVSL